MGPLLGPLCGTLEIDITAHTRDESSTLQAVLERDFCVRRFSARWQACLALEWELERALEVSTGLALAAVKRCAFVFFLVFVKQFGCGFHGCFTDFMLWRMCVCVIVLFGGVCVLVWGLG